MRLFFLVLIVFYTPDSIPLAAGKTDSSAIYFNQRQYDTDDRQLFCFYRIGEKAGIMWSDFQYEASGTIRIGKKYGTHELFEPDAIYGFFMNGIKYRYIGPEKIYLAELGSAAGTNST